MLSLRRERSWRLVPPLPCSSHQPSGRACRGSSTTVTVNGLRWSGRLRRREVGVQDGGDLRPQTGPDPEGIAGIDRLPRPAGWGDVAPRPTAVHHGEHPLQLAPQIASGTSPTRDHGLHQRRDLRPGGLAERRGAQHDVDRDRSGRRGTGLRRGRTLRATSPMATTCHRLVLAPPQRPVQVVRPRGRGTGRLGHEQQQASHLGDRQGDPVGRAAPFSPFWASPVRALRRVTSRAAWAKRARVT